MKSEMKNQKLKRRINKIIGTFSKNCVSNEKVKKKRQKLKEGSNRKLNRTTEPTTTKLGQQEFTLISKRNRQLSIRSKSDNSGRKLDNRRKD